jgi:signal transduction histidine kinase
MRGVKCMSIDVIEYGKLKTSKQRVKYLLSQLHEADASKRDIVNTLSHEIRNPLATLSIGISVLEKYLSDDNNANNALEIVKRQLSNLNRLAEDLLDYTKITLNKYKLSKEKINFTALVSTIVKDYELQTIKKGISLTANTCEEPLEIMADYKGITHVMQNLLNNALKFTNSGGSIIVELLKDYESGEAVIAVKDTGVGFNSFRASRLFEPFVQMKDQMVNNDGLGLGLAIVRSIVELHGGNVKAFSEGIGKGACFLFRIPIIE